MGVKTIHVDDLDQKEGTEANPVLTWRFGLGPRNAFKMYDIDLTEKNYAKLQEALAPFIDVAAEVGESSSFASPPRQRAPRGQAVTGPNKPVTVGGKTAKEVRETLRANGYEVKDGGRFSQKQKDEYEHTTKDKFL